MTTTILTPATKRFQTIAYKRLGLVLRAIARQEPLDDRLYMVMFSVLDEALAYGHRAGINLEKEVSWAFSQLWGLNSKAKAAPPEALTETHAAPPEGDAP